MLGSNRHPAMCGRFIRSADFGGGFLASCMLEIAPGVYTQPDMSVSVRERVWTVLSGWWAY